ncbi:MAG: exosortase system-associated protein, TIGR04073 family [Chthoniobacterales bacterium]|nr:exosortase system-associated protein, TIGR04073 family [Chthoniobacterales bacterium]
MKTLVAAALLIGLVGLCRADIHDPPSNQHGPTRKLGRAVSNILYGWSELPTTIAKVNETEGNSAAAGYGVVRGVGRSVMRMQAGIFELLTWPIPAVRGSYYPVLASDTHWIHSGYKEFPPELGNESRYPYVRHY